MTSSPTRPHLIAHEIYRASRYAPGHPLAIPRVSACLDLIKALGWFDPARYTSSPQATPEQLARFHDPGYVADLQHAEAVANRSGGVLEPEIAQKRQLGIAGNPLYPEMFRRPATSCGGTMLAADQIADWAAAGQSGVIHHPAGGTHHGRPDRASGFCFLNDPVLGLLRLLDRGIAPLAYVDLDAHHGDGVQDAFAGDPRVWTISIHEANRWPRTGPVADRGQGGESGAGSEGEEGFARNLPVPQGLNDSEFACLLDEAVLPLLERITPKPQVLMIQGGCDALADDPQSRMQLSNGALWRAVDRLCAVVPRVILLGGGGYNPMAVARCWAGYWGVINGFDVPERLPAEAEAMLRGLEWQHRRARNAPERLYTTLQDPANEGPIRPEIRALCREVLR